MPRFGYQSRPRPFTRELRRFPGTAVGRNRFIAPFRGQALNKMAQCPSPIAPDGPAARRHRRITPATEVWVRQRLLRACVQPLPALPCRECKQASKICWRWLARQEPAPNRGCVEPFPALQFSLLSSQAPFPPYTLHMAPIKRGTRRAAIVISNRLRNSVSAAEARRARD